MDLSSHGGEMAIPMPISSKYVGHDTVHHQATANGPPPPTPSPPTSTTDQYHQHSLSYNMSNMAVKKGGGGGVVVVKYRECLKNHAAAIGGNATDGCGEFMPSGEEGSMEALKCSACNCHRNFHRKEVEGEPSPHDYPPSSFPHQYHQFLKGGGGGRSKVVGQKGVLVSSHNSSAADPFGYSPILPLPSPHHHHHHMVMPIGALQTSESDEMEGGGGIVSRPPTARKRFRTKFTQEQKEKMLSFAEKVGWRLQKQEEGVVQQFCQEIGVKRRVLKVWMHNNKHNLAKKNNTTTGGGGGGGGTTTTTGIIINNNNSNNPIQMQVQPPDHVPMQTDHV